jgi:hypothetical protein
LSQYDSNRKSDDGDEGHDAAMFPTRLITDGWGVK